jgi:uncharacterized protein YbbC (DUF1343 family)
MIKVGIERLDEHLNLFKDQRVGLITNPTGVDRNFRSTIDLLTEKVNVTALFSPEHGIRGNLQAGVHLEPYVDEKTNVMVYSLYGKTRKPTKEMLDGIDVLAFDMQDVGARFYTYLYTMAYAMIACAEYGKKFVVFDRPNPLDGVHVEGNILDLDYRSFVGYYELPQRYGLTIGELARLFNDVYKIGCDLEVVLMDGWKREMSYQDTGLHWILPSPNIPTPDSVYPYVGTCIFEGTNLSEGRGTTKPFELIGAPWLKADEVIEAFHKYQLKGIRLRKHYFTPMFSKHQGELCAGVQVYITDKNQADIVYGSMVLFNVIKELHQEFELLPPFKEGAHRFLNLLVGTDFLSKEHIDLKTIKQKMNADKFTFSKIKEKYHLYAL